MFICWPLRLSGCLLLCLFVLSVYLLVPLFTRREYDHPKKSTVTIEHLELGRSLRQIKETYFYRWKRQRSISSVISVNIITRASVEIYFPIATPALLRRKTVQLYKHKSYMPRGFKCCRKENLLFLIPENRVGFYDPTKLTVSKLKAIQPAQKHLLYFFLAHIQHGNT